MPKYDAVENPYLPYLVNAVAVLLLLAVALGVMEPSSLPFAEEWAVQASGRAPSE